MKPIKSNYGNWIVLDSTVIVNREDHTRSITVKCQCGATGPVVRELVNLQRGASQGCGSCRTERMRAKCQRKKNA